MPQLSQAHARNFIKHRIRKDYFSRGQLANTLVISMGCASSAPLVQQGLDAARKAVSRDAVEEKSKSMAKDAIESDQAKGILESVNNAKDEAVEKMEGGMSIYIFTLSFFWPSFALFVVFKFD